MRAEILSAGCSWPTSLEVLCPQPLLQVVTYNERDAALSQHSKDLFISKYRMH